MSPSQHKAWNDLNYPKTLQRCENCGQLTEKCEEDELMIEGFGPVCSECYDDFVASLDETQEKLMEPREETIGNIENYYGGLVVKSENGKFYWSITNYDGDNWDEIPKSLADMVNHLDKS